MSECPDVLGFELDDALARMKREGWQVSVTVTFPPGLIPPGPQRVLRLIVTGERVAEMVVAHQGWGEGKGPDVLSDHE
ncbi:MAG: hypothetical protein IBX71_03825 [Candidatus Desulforudis sp.]|nr:hypothetical protein [Desulforudis sp.]